MSDPFSEGRDAQGLLVAKEMGLPACYSVHDLPAMQHWYLWM